METMKNWAGQRVLMLFQKLVSPLWLESSNENSIKIPVKILSWTLFILVMWTLIWPVIKVLLQLKKVRNHIPEYLLIIESNNNSPIGILNSLKICDFYMEDSFGHGVTDSSIFLSKRKLLIQILASCVRNSL